MYLNQNVSIKNNLSILLESCLHGPHTSRLGGYTLEKLLTIDTDLAKLFLRWMRNDLMFTSLYLTVSSPISSSIVEIWGRRRKTFSVLVNFKVSISTKASIAVSLTPGGVDLTPGGVDSSSILGVPIQVNPNWSTYLPLESTELVVVLELPMSCLLPCSLLLKNS